MRATKSEAIKEEALEAPQGHPRLHSFEEPAEWMVLEVLHRDPAGPAPLVPLEGGRFATPT